MKLPTVEVVEVHYWAVLMRDEHRPDGEEYPIRYPSRLEADAKCHHFVNIQLATRAHSEDTI